MMELPPFDQSEQARLEQLLQAQSEQLRQALIDLERSYDFTLEVVGDAHGLRDADSQGHSRRVTAFTISIARAMRLSRDQIGVIARGAFLHDIGMIAMPDSILRKKGPLSTDETKVMREHCVRGYIILKKIPFLSEAAEIVYAHQEQYDGTGYPRGLRGHDIPLGARIVAITDTLDAMTSDRPYRLAGTVQEAYREVERLSGKQFDPEIARVLFEIPATIWEKLATEVSKYIP